MSASLYTLRDARHEQIANILELLSRLASFELTARRQPEDLWNGDAELLKGWARGELPEALIKVAEDPSGMVLGVAFAQMRLEALPDTERASGGSGGRRAGTGPGNWQGSGKRG